MSGQTYYKDGYDSTISNSHSWRTAENSSAYLLPHLKPTDKILDVGCGPGTITYGLAKYIPQGEIIGIEPTSELIEEAINNKVDSDTGPRGKVKFEEASAFELPYEDESFDVVHAHQVIIHLSEPLKALKEMKRVLKKGGYLALRDSELRSALVYPKQYEDPIKYYFDKIRSEYTSIDAASTSKQFTIDAGFKPEDIVNTTSTWCISSRYDRSWFSEIYIKRSTKLNFKPEDKYDQAQLETAWKQWADDDYSWFVLLHGEVIAKKN
ncbi:Ubiquinone/menaquinone biosynthesis methyltransferase [Wickerhamomyces ciferrii]|uniref:Ubiquinone/menaquinone biosynthesis methyltransferase n=1 Tax=Wickerhamomyces ciferrii (strain ATCC 14091 / BCRC 22168 / CBS 111 / JCM 3599 / NBRC 0793 / NRRL Y-1031 F-60-10) TaxID=1206466 RepID=K0KPZ2_WICCF|nr:Ubiquinone/menaquinone biosynthesis methyltransferase [Wickerhamomyces ciferrii]CCH44232.1 Ubiquinone/menaquinone biosynthesis methyltransferase [Wickerhamomyces ciferrii]